MSTHYADIIVNISHENVDRPFQYAIPNRLLASIQIGTGVLVPFGKGNRLITGYCIGLSQESVLPPQKVKEIAGVSPNSTPLEERMILLAAWIRRTFGATMSQALKTVLPAKQTIKQAQRRVIVRLLTKEETISRLGEATRKSQTAKARLLTELIQYETIPYEWITGKLGVSAQTIRSLSLEDAIRVEATSYYRNPVNKDIAPLEEPREALQLSDEQTAFVREVMTDY
ncbi:MAG: primosomal protein N', partial [Lachnospiraceae bacterium]|nr:primosomal protein N' [Lachnospiraceae bacterium]